MPTFSSIVIGGPTVALGLFGLIKRLRGRRVAGVEHLDVGTVRLVLDDGTVLELRVEVLTLYQTVSISRRAAEVVAPLEQEGVNLLRFRTDQDMNISVEKVDLPAFAVPALPSVPLLDATTELNLKIVAVTFQEDNKWRFSDGERVFYAAVEDHDYLSRVQNAEEAFRNGDILCVGLRVHQEQSADGDLRTEYTIKKVLAHVPRERGIQLPMVEPPENGESF